jgi:hypothetical protein
VSSVRSITEKRWIIKRTSSDSGIPQGVVTFKMSLPGSGIVSSTINCYVCSNQLLGFLLRVGLSEILASNTKYLLIVKIII